jgi:tRNA A37 threonylcarbamoyladenosine dehydratase
MELPKILDFNKSRDRQEIQALLKNSHIRVVDEIEEQCRELYYVNHPKFLGQSKKPKIKTSSSMGRWVYLPWKAALVHILNKSDFQKLRTSRNQDLILKKEQQRFGDAHIGIAGLNVGNPAAVCLALEGGGNNMKFADYDALSVSNLNRFRAGIADLGLNKVIISAQQIYEINPYAKLTLYDQGITVENIDNFLNKPRINVLVEEMDNMLLKILIRERARHFRIPVVMVTGSGPDVVIDVERYDLDPKLKILNNYLKEEVSEPILSGEFKNLPFKKKIGLMQDFMGKQYLHPRLVKSFSLVGKTLAGIPQLAESSFLRGASVTYVVRSIITGKRMPSGRYSLKLSELV